MSGRVNDVTPLNALAREYERLQERIAELEAALRLGGVGREAAYWAARKHGMALSDGQIAILFDAALDALTRDGVARDR